MDGEGEQYRKMKLLEDALRKGPMVTIAFIEVPRLLVVVKTLGDVSLMGAADIFRLMNQPMKEKIVLDEIHARMDSFESPMIAMINKQERSSNLRDKNGTILN